MRPILIATLFAPLLAVSACNQFPLPPAAEEDPCGASGYRDLVGQNFAAVTLPADLNARIIGPDTAVTMDFQPERLNIYVGEDGLVDRVSCG